MPSAFIVEPVESRQSTIAGRNSAHQRTYRVKGYSNEADALALAEAARPATITHPSSGIELSFIVPKAKQIAPDAWEISFDYSHKNSHRAEVQKEALLEQGDMEVSFRFRTASIVRKESYPNTNQRTYWIAGEPAPTTYGEMLNVSGGEPRGVRIAEEGSGVLKHTKVLPASTVEDNWMRSRANLCVLGAVNTDTVELAGSSHAPGTLSFRSFSGTKQGSGDWLVSFGFATSRNVDPAPPEPEVDPNPEERTVAGIYIKDGWLGHEYVWTLYRMTEDSTAKISKPQAAAAFVARIYPHVSYGEELVI